MGVAAVVLLGFTLRLWRLAHLGDLEFDEIVSVKYAALPGAQLVPLLAGALFEHPPAFYLALGWWQGAFGLSDAAARLFSVIPGTLCIPLTNAVARRLYGGLDGGLDRGRQGRRAGLLAALLVAIAPLPLFYSREARMYALVSALGLVCLWLFLGGLRRPDTPDTPARPRSGGWRRWGAYAVLGALTAYVHYLGALQMAGLCVAAGLLRRRAPQVLLPVVLSTVSIGALALPWIVSASGTRASLPALALDNLQGLPVVLWTAWRDLAAGPESSGVLASIGALTLLWLAVAGFPRRPVQGIVAGVMLGAGLAGLLFVVGLGKPVQARYVLPMAPLVFICAAGALRRGGMTLALGVLGLLLAFAPFWARYYSAYSRADYSAITRRIGALERPGDGVLLTGPWQAWYFDYYYGGRLSHEVLPQNAPPALDPAVARAQLEALARGHRRLWLVQAGLAQADPTNYVERWLLRNAWPATREAHQNAVLSNFALQAPRLTRPLLPVAFGAGLRLVGGWVDGEEIPAGDIVRLTLELEASQPLPVDYKASLRLVGVDGQRTAVDFDLLDRQESGERGPSSWAPGQRITIRRGIWAPASLGPQPYSVRLVVYDPATLVPLAPLAPLAPTGDDPLASPGGETPIGDVYVTQSLAALSAGAEAPYQSLDRQFGGGDDFDAVQLVGVRQGQPNPSAAPISFDLLWRLDGFSGTEHRSTISVVDGAGRVWAEETRPLFGGTFAMHDWREHETLAERRAVDLTALPAGHYYLRVGLQDARGRALPVASRAPLASGSPVVSDAPVASGSPVTSDAPVATTTSTPGVSTVELATIELPYRRPLGERVAGLLQRIAGLAGR